MSGLFTSLRVSSNALYVQQMGIQTASANIANANTPGYSKRVLRVDENRGYAPYGSGITASGPFRQHDVFLSAQLKKTAAELGYASMKDSQLSQLQGVVVKLDGSGLEGSLNQFFSSLSSLANDPTKLTSRQDVMFKAQQATQSFNNAAADIQGARDGINDEIATNVQTINGLLSNFSATYRDILRTETPDTEASPLRDKLDTLAEQIASLTGGKVFIDGSGRTSVQAFGTTLADGEHVSQLSTAVNASGYRDITVVDWNGGTQNVTAKVKEGELGAQLELRDTVMQGYQDQLDTLAFEFATQMNTLHSAGYGLDSQTGRALFTTTATSTGAAAALQVSSVIAADPNKFAASSTMAGVPGNNANAVAMIQLGHSGISGLNNVTFGDASIRLMTNIANDTAQAKAAQSNAKDRHATIGSMNQSIVGVSVTEETLNMLQFQRAFESSAKVVQTIDQLLQTVIAMKS